MKEVRYIENPEESLSKIKKLTYYLFYGFEALALDYNYHINNVMLSPYIGKERILEMRDSINYRIKSAEFHYYLLLRRKLEIENEFEELLQKEPGIFHKYWGSNPYFRNAQDEIMSIYDSIIFHLSSSFDYLAMLVNYIFGKNPQENVNWMSLKRSCYAENSIYQNRIFVENIRKTDKEFVSKFYDYRSELIHRKNSEAYTNLSWDVNSSENQITNLNIKFKCSDKLKNHFKKIIQKDQDYCITYLSFETIKNSILHIANILEGINDEFRTNYIQNAPNLKEGGFQIISYNPETMNAESPAIGSWKKFLEIKNVS